MPGCPLRRTCARPHEGAYTATASEAAYRPTWLLGSFVCEVHVDWPAAIASKLAPTVFTVNTNYSNHTKPVGAGLPAKRPAHLTLMLADRPPSLASQLPQGRGTSARFRSAVRPPSLASQLLQGMALAAALHHSPGRALARLQLLILIHPPPRQAEWRCSSGDGRAAPFDAVELIACRSKRSRPEGNAPG
ncbi:UNVERIFIED_ORG: hypothetical protein J2Y84_003978 [Pseudomonas reinekei]|nr:hypothetical protein [Pseudomonas reinekei]